MLREKKLVTLGLEHMLQTLQRRRKYIGAILPDEHAQHRCLFPICFSNKTPP